MPRKVSVDDRQTMVKVMTLFWVKGYMATTIDDLSEETGYSKSFIYSNFGKKGLFQAAFFFYMENYTDPFLKALNDDSRGIDAIRDKLMNLTDSLMNHTMPKACLFVNTVVEMGSKDEDFDFMSTQYIDRVTKMYEKKVRYCHSIGEIQQVHRIPLYTNILVNLLFSLAVMYKTHSRADLEDFIDSQLRLLK